MVSGPVSGFPLYDPESRWGGLAHCLLPEAPSGVDVTRPGKFVTAAIPCLVDLLVEEGARREQLTAKLCGGAAMFRPGDAESRDGIGRRNLAAARRQLGQLGIPLQAEDVGGDFGRTMELDLSSGMILVRTVRGRDKLKKI